MFGKNIKNSDFNSHFSNSLLEIPLISEPNVSNHVTTKAYVDSTSKKDRNRQDMSEVFNDDDNDFDNSNLTNL